MKAILRSFSGFTREIPIYPPPPESFTMAVSESGAQIWNPHDLMTGEASVFKSAKFVKTIADPNDDAWIYQQESNPTLYSQVTKALVEKLRPSIIKAMDSQSVFYNMLKTKPVKTVESQMTNDEAEKLVLLHQKMHGYSPEIEGKMAELGQKIKPEPGEPPYEFLTRLYHLVTMLSDDKEEYKLQLLKQQMAQQMKLQELQEKQLPYVSQSNYYYAASTAAYPGGGILQPAVAPDGLTVPPKVEPEPKPEPKKELPDPVEPKKRLMRKDRSS
jgi:hypothetical protein